MKETELTAEERQELETLRSEKHARCQTERAAAALSGHGVPQGFAALLIGSDDADTDRRVQAFCETYQSSLTHDIRKRLPDTAPTLTAPQPVRPKRGIQRLR